MGSSAIPRNLKQMTLITQNGLTRWRSGALTGVLRANCDCFQDLGYHRLPNAPSMKIYCIYGHGKETEACHVIVGVNVSYSNAMPKLAILLVRDASNQVLESSFLTFHPLLGMLGESMTETYRMQTSRTHNVLTRRAVQLKALFQKL